MSDLARTVKRVKARIDRLESISEASVRVYVDLASGEPLELTFGLDDELVLKRPAIWWWFDFLAGFTAADEVREWFRRGEVPGDEIGRALAGREGVMLFNPETHGFAWEPRWKPADVLPGYISTKAPAGYLPAGSKA